MLYKLSHGWLISLSIVFSGVVSMMVCLHLICSLMNTFHYMDMFHLPISQVTFGLLLHFGHYE